jgi:hypothetical protein
LAPAIAATKAININQLTDADNKGSMLLMPLSEVAVLNAPP